MYLRTCFADSGGVKDEIQSRLRLFKIVIRPIVTYGNDDWVLTKAEEN